MIVLVSGATTYPRDSHVGHLIMPRQWNDPAKLGLDRCCHALDNGCFVGLDEGAFLRMLEAYQPYQQYRCLFATVPDRVGDAASTLRLWAFWAPIVRTLGWSLAFVAQNGLTPRRMPWDELGTLFIGGDNAYKEGTEARTLCGLAKAKGKWVHWGRVNGKRRYELARIAGADSIDGTGFSMHSDTNIPKVAEWDAALDLQSGLFV